MSHGVMHAVHDISVPFLAIRSRRSMHCNRINNLRGRPAAFLQNQVGVCFLTTLLNTKAATQLRVKLTCCSPSPLAPEVWYKIKNQY
jgi:hypothetical protein